MSSPEILREKALELLGRKEFEDLQNEVRVLTKILFPDELPVQMVKVIYRKRTSLMLANLKRIVIVENNLHEGINVNQIKIGDIKQITFTSQITWGNIEIITNDGTELIENVAIFGGKKFVDWVQAQINASSKVNYTNTKSKVEPMQKIVVKSYNGNEDIANSNFRKDAILMAQEGYFPTTQSYTVGQWGCASFVIATILCFVIIGFLVFLYMLIVKPEGVLTVTYEYKGIEEAQNTKQSTPLRIEEKTCPMCAETVKLQAKICRYCGHNFY
ncbi:zinc ribbon domain-containing protein [Flectobacillus sp. DC10W]|uniref:Zinc ribbon domain-containing protein n=1 Tax=Flectobacillus longus TaxID=2984207 RepID=A0ABT6YLC4_9BACT|nr:zinc ribbon domain-containing protein [Flectobacillus longus]MDI9864409.1 zinc ribbon domain-containing protein [Flectobacillus longus]